MTAEAAADAFDKTTLLSQLLHQHPWYALALITLGFIGGTISGFIGSGGAFLMTPGMMNLGIPGIMAVGANITHKFGKAMMGQKKHGQLGHVDRRLGLFLLVTSLAGIRVAVMVNEFFYERLGDAGSNLYVSTFFVLTLSIIGYFIMRDAIRSLRGRGGPASRKLQHRFRKLNLPPTIYFKTANVRVSVIMLIIVGFCVGFMAGTIGVGGFIGVPAMIYLFGIPTVVATGTELFLAMFMGAFGALNYGAEGFVDIRITLLLFAGSMVGLFVGSIGTKMVREVYIRTVTGALILLCTVSRALAIPDYLRTLHYIHVGTQMIHRLEVTSAVVLFTSGIGSTVFILYFVLRAHLRQLHVFRRYRAAIEAPETVQGTSDSSPAELPDNSALPHSQ